MLPIGFAFIKPNVDFSLDKLWVHSCHTFEMASGAPGMAQFGAWVAPQIVLFKKYRV